ncbi:MAG: hypothetical protein AAFO81_06270 [Pseudomonadota bacterium]
MFDLQQVLSSTHSSIWRAVNQAPSSDLGVRQVQSLLILLCVSFAIAGCSSGGSDNSAPPPVVSTPPPPPATPTLPVDEAQLTVVSTRTLTSDGAGQGSDTYDLIRAFGGPRPIEAPDLYPINHPGVAHIYEDSDSEVGNHFVFIIHRDTDIDRDRQDITDRQRNEIKTYSSSETAVKGFEDETFVYRWKFRINEQMAVSTRFSHFFQLKAVGGSDSQPIITISGAERSGEDGIEVRHSPLQETEILDRTDWSSVTGEWLQAYVRATFSDTGGFRMIVTRLRDDAVIFDIDVASLDLWRGESPDHFVRPKWGIYRSILDRDNLRPDEEQVRFADFEVSKVMFAE